MKHFFGLVILVFAGLFVFYSKKTDEALQSRNLPVLRVFGYSSFTSSYGPGPSLKLEFEKFCNCRVEFIEGSDSGILLQRLKIEGESLGADLVLGLDQFDLSKAQSEFPWKTMKVDIETFDRQVRPAMTNPAFIPYDWGVLSFVSRKNLASVPKQLDDLLRPEWKGRFALQDPRTSSPGFQFVMWVLHAKGYDEGFRFLGQLIKQAHGVSGSWSQSYGLFQKAQVDLVFSYTTSPMYHLLEEKSDQFQALEFRESHPVQVEYVGIPEYCRNCELAEEFVKFIISPPGQQIIMRKNFMFPVLTSVRSKSEFNEVPLFSTFHQSEIFSEEKVQQILKRWIEQRRGE